MDTRHGAQAISEPDERYEAYCASSDFIREHIFPGGHLPSMDAMVDAARGTGLSVQVPPQGCLLSLRRCLRGWQTTGELVHLLAAALRSADIPAAKRKHAAHLLGPESPS